MSNKTKVATKNLKNDRKGLSVNFNWRIENELGRFDLSAAEATKGTIDLTVNDVSWLHNFEWVWVDLLEWLTDSLKKIRETPVPEDVVLDSTNNLMANLEGDNDNVRSELWDFLYSHDLKNALQSTGATATIPNLVVWEIDGKGFIRVGGTTMIFAWHDIYDFLLEIGDKIAARLLAFSNDSRSQSAAMGWLSGPGQFEG